MRYVYCLFAALLFISANSFSRPDQPYSDLASAWFGITVTTPPIVTTSAPDSISQTSARLNGSVNPRNFSTTAVFHFGLTQTYTFSAGSTSVGNGGISVALHTVLTGLLPRTTYHYALSATSGQGTADGSDVSFTTLPYPPVTTIDTPLSITYNSARFVATVVPNGAPTVVHFEWSTDFSYSHSTANQSIGSDTIAANVQFDITGLSPGTDYHVRVAAVNGGGTTRSLDMPFRTLNTPPVAITGNPGTIGRTYAILTGTGITAELTGTGWFQWGTTTSYGDSTPVVSLLSGAGSSFSSGLTGLTPGSTIHYRCVVVSSAGIVYGNDRYLTTLVSSREYTPDSKTALLLHFNEADQTLLEDYSFNGDNPAVTGTFSYPGLYGNGRTLTAGLDVVQMPADTMLDFHDQSFTLEGWVLSHLGGGADFVIYSRGRYTSNSESFRLTLLRSGQVDLVLNGTGLVGDRYEMISTNAVVNEGSWHHIAAIVDMGKHSASILIDGAVVPVTVSGGFPASLYSSSDIVQIGSSGPPSSQRIASGTLPYVLIDEFRISRTARTRAELHVGGAIAGTVFNDENANGVHNSGEPGLDGWKIVLFRAISTTRIDEIDSVISDADGNYVFDALDPGVYFTREALQNGWIRTLPRGNSLKLVALQSFSFADNLDYGNVFGCRYIGPPGGTWSNPAHWSCGHAPTSDDPIVIPNDTSVSIDGLPGDSINALRIGRGGRLAFGNIAHKLKIRGSVQIDSGGTLTLPGSDDGTGMNCFGDWLNYGSFDPGHSTVVFSGPDPKTIIYSYGSSNDVTKPGTKHRTPQASNPGNQFYNLQISGDSTSVSGNITVQNSLTLNADLSAQPTDTVFISNDSTNAITGLGKVTSGTISRAIHAGSTGSYRFESSFSTVQFTDSPVYPGSLIETPAADTIPRAWQLYWEQIPGTVNLTDHSITADHVNHFSKWIVGRPGGSNKPLTHPHVYNGQSFQTGFDTTTAVRRMYTIGVDDHNGSFDARISLRYDPAEIGGALNEALLQLFRGPMVVDSVQTGWNLVSVPVEPEISTLGSLFPSASSNAYAFTNTYISASTLIAGSGYWLKFPASRPDSILGADFEQITIAVNEGWNLIGALSYPTSTSNISSDDGVTFGTVYGYSHGYVSTTTLIPLHAYWLKATQGGHLTITAPPVGTVAPKHSGTTAASSDGLTRGMTQLTITGKDGHSQTLFSGIGISQDRRLFELPPPPPDGSFDVRYESNLAAALASSSGSKEYAIEISNAAYPIRISWDQRTATEVDAIQTSDGKSYSMSRTGTLMIASPSTSLKVRTPQSGSVMAADIPRLFALYQNYPNPFNPATEIRFDLPQDSKVNLTIYNVLGQKVATLIDGALMMAGQHRKTFDASDFSSGVYFYTLQAGTFTSIRKMVLLR